MWKALTISSLAMSLITLPAGAAIITYEFTVLPDSGPLAGESYEGLFSYDDSTLSGIGSEFLPETAITALNFEFEGVSYDLGDAFSAGVEFLDGELLGLAYVTDVEFAFVPGVTSLGEAFFSYDLDPGAGFGDIDYVLLNVPTVPEPSIWIGLAGLAGVGLVRRLRTN